jgi:hypothetical protein
MIYLKNSWMSLDEIWCELYAIGVSSNMVLTYWMERSPEGRGWWGVPGGCCDVLWSDMEKQIHGWEQTSMQDRVALAQWNHQ